MQIVRKRETSPDNDENSNPHKKQKTADQLFQLHQEKV